MVGKTILLICATALFIKCVSSQYIGGGCNPAANAMAWEAAAAAPCGGTWNSGLYSAGAPFATQFGAGPMASSQYFNAEWAGYSPASLAASNGGGLAVTSASSIPPSGVAMTSENIYEGPLTMAGTIPFLGGVAVEGVLPTAGAGAVSYGCGNGNVAMLSEDFAPLGYNALGGAYGYGPGAAVELGYGYSLPSAYEAGIAGPGYGYRNCGCGSMY